MASGGKSERQARILHLVTAGAVDTQEDLAARLHSEGFAVTQATISRDVRELRLLKVPTGAGRYRYAPAEGPPPPAGLSERMLRHLFRECVTGLEHSEALVVISTLPGTAQSVAEAVDGLGAQEAIGTLSGERTVFVVVKPLAAVPRFLRRLRRLMAPVHRR